MVSHMPAKSRMAVNYVITFTFPRDTAPIKARSLLELHAVLSDRGVILLGESWKWREVLVKRVVLLLTYRKRAFPLR